MCDFVKNLQLCSLKTHFSFTWFHDITNDVGQKTFLTHLYHESKLKLRSKPFIYISRIISFMTAMNVKVERDTYYTTGTYTITIC